MVKASNHTARLFQNCKWFYAHAPPPTWQFGSDIQSSFVALEAGRFSVMAGTGGIFWSFWPNCRSDSNRQRRRLKLQELAELPGEWAAPR
jgi:hypothetical protein